MGFPILVVPSLRVNGIALFPFILVRLESSKHDETLIRHETIHLWQELEMLVLPFYIVYLCNYLINLRRYKNHHQAYLNIIFEREAYAEEIKNGYLKHRKFWAWLNY